MIYDGILAKLLGIDLALMEQALGKQLGKKAKAVTLNQGALKAGWDYAEANFTKQDPFFIEPMNETAGKILIEGNAAAAIGCMMAGVTVVAWYPITPSSSLCESLIGYMKKYRIDKDDRQGDVRDRAGRRRDRVARHGDRRELGGRALDDRDGRPRHLADVGVHRPRVLRRDAGGDLRRPARRAVDRAADAHRAGRPPLRRRSSRTATPSTSCCIPSLGGGVLHDGAGGVRPRRAVPDAGVRDAGPRPRHEQLDVRRRSSIPDKPINRGKLLDAGSAEEARRVGPLQGRRRRRHRLSHDSGRRHAGVLHARLGPQRQGAVQRAARRLRREHGPARRASSRRRAKHVPKPDRRARRRARKIGFIALRHVALGDHREPRSAARGDRRQDVVLPAARLSVHRRSSRRSSTRTSASTSSSRTATRSCCS